MEKRKFGQANNLEAVSPSTLAVNEEEHLEGKLGAARDSETWGVLEDDDAQTSEADDDGRRDYIEADLAEKAEEMFQEFFKGNLSPEVLKAAFKVTIG